MAAFVIHRSTRSSLASWSLVSLVLFSLAFASPALAQLTTGDVLAGVGAGKIKRFNSSGVLQQTLDSGTTSSETTGMCFDASANLFGTLFSISQVAKYNSAGTLLTNTFGSGFSSAESCVVDAAGNIFFGQGNGVTIKKFNPAGTLITDFSPATGPRGTDWIDLAADQCTMHYTSEGGAIKTFNVCTNTQGPDFATGLSGGACYAHRIRPNGEELVACTTAVHRLSSAGAVLQSYNAGSFTPPESFVFALNLDPDGTTFWTGGISSGRVYRVNIATGAQVTSFNAGILGGSMAGLAVVGEIVVSQPTPTPGVAVTATPTVPPRPSNIPTLDTPTMAILGLLLAALGVLLMRRTR